MSSAKPEPRALPKRFYSNAAVQQVTGGFGITLDGKLLRTQARKPLYVASQQLVQQLAAEWQAQYEVINPDTMPLTRLINLALDRADTDRAAWCADIAAYVETDLLYYRVPLEDQEVKTQPLRMRQDAIFNPILAWITDSYGTAWITTDGLMPVPQPPASLQKIAAVFAAANNHEIAALAMLTPLLGSALLALALWKGQVSVEQALIAARLEEDFEAERWGVDADVAANWHAKCGDIRAAVVYLMHHAMPNRCDVS